MSSLRLHHECSICLGSYQKPKVLSCFHTYCLQCIKNYSGGGDEGTIKCPLCRQLTYIPEEGVDGLPDLTVKKSTSKDDTEYCGFCCSDTAAEFRCRECEDCLCFKCKEQHIRMKQTKDHVLDVYEETQVYKKELDVEFCQLHATFELQYYCTVCGVGCCKMCFHQTHKNHPSRTLPMVVEEKRDMIRNHIEEAKEHYVTVVHDVCDILIEQDDLNTILQQTVSNIDNVVDRLKHRLDAVSEGIKNQVSETGQTLNQKLKSSLEINNSKSKSILSIIQSTSEILSEATNQDFLSLERDMLYHLQEEKTKASLKDVRVSYLSSANVEEIILNNIRTQPDDPVDCSILHPLVLNKLVTSFRTEGNKLSAITCLSNGAILVCYGQKKRLHVLSVRGEDFGSFTLPFRVGNVIQAPDNCLITTEYNGPRVAKFFIYSDGIEKVAKLHGFIQGVSLTHDGNSVIFCCNETKDDSKKHKSNAQLLLTNHSLEIQMQVNVNSGGDIIRYAAQKGNGDFIAMTSGKCFILSSVGCMKSTYNFYGQVHSACLDKKDNILILREEEQSNAVSLYDSKFEVLKDLFRFTKEPKKRNANCCMTLGGQDTIWVGFSDRVQSIKYTF